MANPDTPVTELTVRFMDKRPFEIQLHPVRLTNSLIVTGLEQSSFNWLLKDNTRSPHGRIISRACSTRPSSTYTSMKAFTLTI
jgi:hypothetical protein